MANFKKVYRLVMSGNVKNLSFDDFIKFLESLGFEVREGGKGSHKIASYKGVPSILTLQPKKDGMTKDYQARQARRLIKQYKIGGENDEI